MISLQAIDDVANIQSMKHAYLATLQAPLDGMWDAIANGSPHWTILVDGEPAGYFVTDESGVLLQFHLRPEYGPLSAEVFRYVLKERAIGSALVSTADPLLDPLCEAIASASVDHTLLYEIDSEKERMPVVVTQGLTFQPVDATDLGRVVLFQQSCLDSEQDMTDWLRGYSSNLIARGELFCLYRRNEWIGLGELRRSDSQPGIADLGVMVSPEYRRRGWATDILVRLLAICDREGLQAICSTTVDNIASQKAIERAGFVSRHRLVEVNFVSEVRGPKSE